MSRTLRKGRNNGEKIPDKDLNPYWYKHDSTDDRETLNKEFRKEEKQYLRKFGDSKYNQKPKSKGWETN